MRIPFAKYEGLGNDFVIIDGRFAVSAAQAMRVCDRHRGIGADGVLLVDAPEVGNAQRPRMHVINADGSTPEMCGNGIRCVALHLIHSGVRNAGAPFEIATDAGPHVCRVAGSGAESSVEVTMRAPSLEPASLPVLAERKLLDDPFEVDDTVVRLSCVSMGNPHAVTFDDLEPAARGKLGPRIEKSERFPRGVNVGFARVLGPQTIELSVWERGVGFTEACGTGACACAVAAVETGRAERYQPIEIRLPGGPLQIVVSEPGASLAMVGPARRVFDGSLDL